MFYGWTYDLHIGTNQKYVRSSRKQRFTTENARVSCSIVLDDASHRGAGGAEKDGRPIMTVRVASDAHVAVIISTVRLCIHAHSARTIFVHRVINSVFTLRAGSPRSECVCLCVCVYASDESADRTGARTGSDDGAFWRKTTARKRTKRIMKNEKKQTSSERSYRRGPARRSDDDNGENVRAETV